MRCVFHGGQHLIDIEGFLERGQVQLAQEFHHSQRQRLDRRRHQDVGMLGRQGGFSGHRLEERMSPSMPGIITSSNTTKPVGWARKRSRAGLPLGAVNTVYPASVSRS